MNKKENKHREQEKVKQSSPKAGPKDTSPNDEKDNKETKLNEFQSEEFDYLRLLNEEQDKYLRLFAEFENYKKRTLKERIELLQNAGQEILIALLPVLDDFERGVKQIQQSDNKALAEGIILIYNKLKETLKQKGLQPMEIKEGSDFDTDFHEAISQITTSNKKLKEKIVEVVEIGYLLNKKVIRYAKVIVGK